MTLAEELWQYVTRLEAIADRWRHPEDAHTRQIARRLRVVRIWLDSLAQAVVLTACLLLPWCLW